MQTPESRLSPIGYSNNSCGYCKNKVGSFSYYATSRSLSPEFYQGLIDRGWRRSGTLLYKPDLRASCCPHYTIRLDAHDFKAIKDQRQTLNRFTNFVLGEEYIRKAGRYYPKTREQVRRKKQIFDIVERVHEPEKETVESTAIKFVNAKLKPPEPLKPAHNFTVTLEQDNFTEEKYAIFENYQRLVHKEPPNKISKYGFKNFLCSSPIRRSSFTLENGQRIERKLGSYHHCYRLDGKLVAVGVLDLLPQCVSGVYFMYSEDVNQWNLGKLGALRELAMAVEFGYRYYYMGFYIHSCIKMRYKGDYHPQYLLDPQIYHWDLLDADLKRRMDKKKYVSLSEERERDAKAGNIKNDTGRKNERNEEVSHVNGMENLYGNSKSTSSSLTLYSRNMPGILSRDEILNPPPPYSLDEINIRFSGRTAVTSDLVAWEQSTIDDVRQVKCIIGQMVSAIGWKLAAEVVVDFDER